MLVRTPEAFSVRLRQEAATAEWEDFKQEAHGMLEDSLARATAELQKEHANDKIRRLLADFKRELAQE